MKSVTSPAERRVTPLRTLLPTVNQASSYRASATGASQSWGVSKFDAVNVSPHRLRRALGEYRKQSFRNDYVAPYEDVQVNENNSYMHVEE